MGIGFQMQWREVYPLVGMGFAKGPFTDLTKRLSHPLSYTFDEERKQAMRNGKA